MRYQGRANAALLLAARAMDADFVEPADERSFGDMQGRTRGCTFELRIDTPPGAKDPEHRPGPSANGDRVGLQRFRHPTLTSVGDDLLK